MTYSCACCENSEASKNCIQDYLSVRSKSIVLFTTSRCKCELPAPICPTCYSCFGRIRRVFKCRWCEKDTLYTTQKKKPYESLTPASIGAVIFQYRMPPSIDSSRLFRSFGMRLSDFSAWRNLAKFFTELDQPFVIHMFDAFMWMNTKKVRRISPTIFQLDDKVCEHSAYMNRIVRMIKTFNLMIHMSRLVCREHRMILKNHDAIMSSRISTMISKQILSKLVNSESGFIKSLSLYYNKYFYNRSPLDTRFMME